LLQLSHEQFTDTNTSVAGKHFANLRHIAQVGEGVGERVVVIQAVGVLGGLAAFEVGSDFGDVEVEWCGHSVLRDGMK